MLAVSVGNEKLVEWSANRMDPPVLAAYLLSDYSAYINGEVVTIDGGEWLRNGGEFSHLEEITEEMWDKLEKSRGK